MKLVINGQISEAPPACRTVADLLAEPQWAGRMIIVEHNGQVLFNKNYAVAVLAEGDRIELVQVVGGG
jgi:sulfur carrier protein